MDSDYKNAWANVSNKSDGEDREHFEAMSQMQKEKNLDDS